MNLFRNIYRISIICARLINIQIFKRKQYRRSQKGYPVDSQGNPILWMTYPIIDFLNSINFRDSKIFEYGSGGSTLWWGNRAKEVVSIEYNQDWLEAIRLFTPANSTLIYHPIDADYATTIHHSKDYFDVIIIDGAHRFSCASNAPERLREGGIIILDNTEWHNNSAEALRKQGFLQIDFPGFCPLNSFPSVTSIFMKPSSESILLKRNGNSIIPVGGKAHLEGICYDDLN